MSQATAYNHHNVFIFILVLTGGREGEAWEISYKIIHFLLPHNKVSLTFHNNFHFICSSTIFATSLSPAL
jgi:hypothetical protein